MAKIIMQIAKFDDEKTRLSIEYDESSLIASKIISSNSEKSRVRISIENLSGEIIHQIIAELGNREYSLPQTINTVNFYLCPKGEFVPPPIRIMNGY